MTKVIDSLAHKLARITNEFLKDKLEKLTAEMDALPHVEALGIASTDLFAWAKDEQGAYRIVKISITQRSYVSSNDALEKLADCIRYAKENLEIYPYPPSLRKKKIDDNGKQRYTEDEYKS